MASIRREIGIGAPPDVVWRALRDLGAIPRLFPTVVQGVRLEEGARVVTFADGSVARELIVDVDDDARRLAYAAVGGRLAHHHASWQVWEDGEGGSRVAWITDLLPDEMAPAIAAMIDAGGADLRRALEGRTSWP